MANELDLKAIRKALEEGAKLKKDYEELLLKKGFSESLIKAVSDNLGTVMEPYLKDMVEASKTANETLVKGITDAFNGDDNEDSQRIVQAIQEGFKHLEIKPQVTVQNSALEVPEPQVHFTMPETIKAILNYDAKNPLPVILMGTNGKPYVFSNMPGAGAGPQTAAGGRGDFFTLSYTNANPLPVTLVSGAGATSAVNLSDSSGVGYSGSNPLPVTIASGAGATTAAVISTADGGSYPAIVNNGDADTSRLALVVDSRMRAFNGTNWDRLANTSGEGNALRVQFANDTVGSVYITGSSGTTTVRLDSPDGPYSGSNPLPITLVSGALTSTKSQIGNTDGDFSVANPLPISGTVVVSSVTATTSTRLDTPDGLISGTNPLPITIVSNSVATTTVRLDSPDGAFSGTNPLPVTLVSNSAASTIAVGTTQKGTVDIGAAPLKTGGIARTTNPAAVVDGAVVDTTYDKLGRQVMRPLHVRDQIATTYATLNSNGETTLIAGVASTFLDIFHIKFANTSTAVVTIDLRCGTGGSVVDTFTVPGSSTIGYAIPAPYPETEVAQAWTIKFNSTAMGTDVSTTTILASALFTKEL